MAIYYYYNVDNVILKFFFDSLKMDPLLASTEGTIGKWMAAARSLFEVALEGGVHEQHGRGHRRKLRQGEADGPPGLQRKRVAQRVPVPAQGVDDNQRLQRQHDAFAPVLKGAVVMFHLPTTLYCPLLFHV
jgi:hypothetical protein